MHATNTSNQRKLPLSFVLENLVAQLHSSALAQFCFDKVSRRFADWQTSTFKVWLNSFEQTIYTLTIYLTCFSPELNRGKIVYLHDPTFKKQYIKKFHITMTIGNDVKSNLSEKFHLLKKYHLPSEVEVLFYKCRSSMACCTFIMTQCIL